VGTSGASGVASLESPLLHQALFTQPRQVPSDLMNQQMPLGVRVGVEEVGWDLGCSLQAADEFRP
jgi:hypothetical protein